MDIKPAAASSPPPPPPPSNSESQNSATQPIQPKREVDDVPADNNGAFDEFDQKPETKPHSIPQHFQILKSADYIKKYQKYEADYTHRLMAKYFSKNNLYGGNIFDDKMTIDEETIMSSRWPSTLTFADPVRGFEDENITGSTSTAETPGNISNGKHTLKKNG